MKHLNANLDNTTNIEVPLLASTRVLGLDADNNIVEISSMTGGGDGDGDIGDGGDFIDTDDGDGNPIGNGDGIIGAGAGTCVTVNASDLTACWAVGNTLSGLSTTDTDCGFSGIIETISSTTVGVAGNYLVDTNGNQEGTLISGTTEYFEWEITNVTAGTNTNDNGIPFEFITPTNNGSGSLTTRISVVVYSVNARTPAATVDAVNDGYIGRSIVGRWSGRGAFAEDRFNDIPLGSSVTVGSSVGGTVTYRKNRLVQTIPVPQTFNAFTNFNADGSAFSGTGGRPIGVFQYNACFPLFSTVGGVDTATVGGTSYQVNTVLWPNTYIDNNRATYITFLINTEDLGLITVGRAGAIYSNPIPSSPVATTVSTEICLANLEVTCGTSVPAPTGTAGDPIVVSVHSPGTPELTNFISGTTNQVLELAGDVDFPADFLTNVQEALARIEYWDAAPNPNPIPGRRDGLFNWITYQSGGSGFSFLTSSGFGRGRTRISAINGNTIASGTTVTTALGNTLQPGQFEIFWDNSQVSNVGLGGPMSLRFNYPSSPLLARTTTSVPPVSTDFTFDKTANAVLGSTGLNDVIRFTDNVSATPTELSITTGMYALTIGVCPEPITTTSLTSQDLIVEGNTTLLGEISTILGDGVAILSNGDLGSTTLPGNTTTFYRGDGTFATVDAGVSYTGADNTIPLSNGVNAASGFDESPITVTAGSTSFVESTTTTTGGITSPGNSFTFTSALAGGTLLNTDADFSSFTIGNRIRITDADNDTVDVILDAIEATGNVFTEGIRVSLIPGVDYSTDVIINGTAGIVFTELEEATAAAETTVAGDLTVGVSVADPITVAGTSWIILNNNTIDSPGIDFTVIPDGASVELSGTVSGSVSTETVIVASTTNQSITFTTNIAAYDTTQSITVSQSGGGGGNLTVTGTIGNPAASGSASFFVEDTGATSAAGAFQFTIADSGDTGTAGFITFVRE